MLHIDIVFGFMVDELESFKDFSLALSMLLATINAANFAQTCPQLPKICPKTKL
jgi:hypothetical protein